LILVSQALLLLHLGEMILVFFHLCSDTKKNRSLSPDHFARSLSSCCAIWYNTSDFILILHYSALFCKILHHDTGSSSHPLASRDPYTLNKPKYFPNKVLTVPLLSLSLLALVRK
jgi:hypothetical protein